MTAQDRSQGRHSRDAAVELASVETTSGHRGLILEEPLIFELGQPGRVGVDLPEAPKAPNRLGALARRGGIGLPDLAEPQVVRHFTRLSQKNYGIDSGFFPLGSCTMKHNPRLNERMARLPGFSDIHPLQPTSTVQGALELIDTLAHWLKTLTGMPAVAMSPAAGAHGDPPGAVAAMGAAVDRLAVRALPAGESRMGDGGAVDAVVDLAGRIDQRHGKRRGGPREREQESEKETGHGSNLG